MNRLELCQRLLQESDLNGTMTTTLSQTNELKRIVDWIDEAYEEIQVSKKTWRFLRSDKSVALSNGTAEYTDATVAHWKTDDFRVYLTATGVSDETRIGFVDWDEYREIYYVGSMRTQTGRPTIFSVKPDNKLIFYPIPDASYTCQAEGFIVPDTMTANADEPVFPGRYHMLPVWRGLMHFGAWNAEPDKFQVGEYNYKKLYRQMVTDQLETMSYGDPLV